MTEQLRSAIGNLIKEKGGDLVRDTLVKAGNEEALKAFDNIENAITEYVAKWVEEIDHADRIPEIISHAWHIALSGRPGPVVLALPEDMLRDEVEGLPAPPRRGCGACADRGPRGAVRRCVVFTGRGPAGACADACGGRGHDLHRRGQRG